MPSKSLNSLNNGINHRQNASTSGTIRPTEISLSPIYLHCLQSAEENAHNFISQVWALNIGIIPHYAVIFEPLIITSESQLPQLKKMEIIYPRRCACDMCLTYELLLIEYDFPKIVRYKLPHLILKTIL